VDFANDPDPAAMQQVRDFLRRSHYMERGAVITDLDGTAVHEVGGRAVIPPQVALGLKGVHDSGRRVVIDTMRFPRSVLRDFAAEWHRITGASIPLVCLKGSQLGEVRPDRHGALVFEEGAAFPLDESELHELMQGIEGMVAQGADELLVFVYPRDWRSGEWIWTPDPARVAAVEQKYLSADRVFSGPPALLRETLLAQDVCLVFLLHDVPEDRRMAYQHTERSRFVTHRGVDKRHGAIEIARRLGVDLAHSVGAGDAEPDNFLGAVGLAVIVGNSELDYKGRLATLRLPDPLAFGQLLLALGAWPA
jgi:hydroxymethylpyrimidine pyrophosphatase-like HAD family hydrolase